MSRSEWDAALADYQAKQAASVAMPLGTEGEDEAVDACCVAMDHLIEDVPAPDINAVLIKMRLALSRAEAFEGLFPEHEKAIFRDLERLAASERPPMFPLLSAARDALSKAVGVELTATAARLWSSNRLDGEAGSFTASADLPESLDHLEVDVEGGVIADIHRVDARSVKVMVVVAR